MSSQAEAQMKLQSGVEMPQNNPLLDRKGLPKFHSIDSSHVTPAIEYLISKLERDFVKFEENLENHTKNGSQHDFITIIDEMEKIEAPLSYAWGVIGHLKLVNESEGLREAHQKMQPCVIKAMQKLGQSRALYNALKYLQTTKAEEKLSEVQKRIVDKKLLDMKHSGVGLEGEEKETFNKMKLELAELSTKFKNNVLDATKAFSILLKDPSEIDGLPDSALEMFAQAARASGEVAATKEKGPWKVTLDQPSYMEIMRHSKIQSLREKIYKAYNSRASSGEGNNEPIIARILELKKAIAKSLGYKSYAELSLSKKMADDVEAVDVLSNTLRDKAFSAALKELDQLKKYADSKGHSGPLELWDYSFWSERQKEDLYSYNAEELKPYFPLPLVLEGLFGIAETLFGVKIVSADGEAEIWNSDVKFFKVKNSQNDSHIASFYLDPYSRPENKNGGAWMDQCLNRSAVMGTIPVCYLICNGSPPIQEKPSLMTFDEVETLFHEFGHGLQHMLTKIQHADASGINGIEWDAVELPSQFMENFVLEEQLVKWKHYKTGEELPRDILKKLKGQKTYMAANALLRQLYFGQLDMELHHRYDPKISSETCFDVQKRIAQKYLVMQPMADDRFLCGFSHIFGGGYSAGYYSYKWSEVMSADAFGAFEEAGLDKKDELAKIGRKFADTVLSSGGGKSPMEVFKEFRGRKPSMEALLRHSGLAS